VTQLVLGLPGSAGAVSKVGMGSLTGKFFDHLENSDANGLFYRRFLPSAETRTTDKITPKTCQGAAKVKIICLTLYSRRKKHPRGSSVHDLNDHGHMALAHSS
jgi:hypothetical protein